MQHLRQRFIKLASTIVIALLVVLPTLATSSIASLRKENVGSQVSCGTIAASSTQAHLQSAAASTTDSDGDGLTDTTEIDRTLTNPCSPDTDDDGLLDPWEVDPAKIDPTVDKAGFDLNFDGTIDATRDAVFGPYAEPNGASQTLPDGRLPNSAQSFALFNQRPDPLHKDIFFELDWQDCKRVGGDCPEPGGFSQLDPTHHAPNLDAIQDVLDVFHNAPVANYDNTVGIHLHILVDESIEHRPNCDRGTSAVRPQHFGTRAQRDDPNITTQG